MSLTIPCNACEGNGHHWEHRPQHDDPYLMVDRGGTCEHCDGDGEIPRECEDCGDPATANVHADAPCPVEPTYLCDNCTEARAESGS